MFIKLKITFCPKMRSSVQLKVIIPVICALACFSTKFGHSTRPPFTDHNREIGSKLAYIQLQHSDTISSLFSTSESTATTAVPKTTTKQPSIFVTTEQPTHFIRIPEENGCGKPKSKPMHSAYVIGGERAHPGEFPWFAAITKYQHNSIPRWKVVCGASLLSNSNYAITAAHCLHGRYKETLELVFNLEDTVNISHTASRGEIRRKIARFVIHPQYNPRTQHNDIALVQFKEPIDLRREKTLAPICLPESDTQTYASKNATFTGFGHTSYGSASPNPKENSRYLMKIHLPILSHSQCLKSKVPTKKNVTENMLCGKIENMRDACINDSGGPLMVTEKGRIVLVGIASWGIGCGLEDYPGVYTRVTQYLPWIKMASSLNLDR